MDTRIRARVVIITVWLSEIVTQQLKVTAMKMTLNIRVKTVAIINITQDGVTTCKL